MFYKKMHLMHITVQDKSFVKKKKKKYLISRNFQEWHIQFRYTVLNSITIIRNYIVQINKALSCRTVALKEKGQVA